MVNGRASGGMGVRASEKKYRMGGWASGGSIEWVVGLVVEWTVG